MDYCKTDSSYLLKIVQRCLICLAENEKIIFRDKKMLEGHFFFVSGRTNLSLPAIKISFTLSSKALLPSNSRNKKFGLLFPLNCKIVLQKELFYSAVVFRRLIEQFFSRPSFKITPSKNELFSTTQPMRIALFV